MNSLHDAGRDAAEQVGITWRPVPQDGRWHEVPAEGKGPRNGAGRVKLFSDGEGGHLWNHITGEETVFWVKGESVLTGEEREARRKRSEELRRQTEFEREQAAAECRKRAVEIWKAAGPAPADHPYLSRKGIKPNGARIHDGRLVIPVRSSDGTLRGLQFIDADGSKKFLTGTAKAGNYASLGGKPKGVLCLAEGFATAATIHEATGHPVAVAFDAGNLKPVAEALRAKLPEVRLILCADDDHGTPGNPGVSKATEAALAVGGLLAVPDFTGTERGPKDSDFNDLARLAGPGAVKVSYAAARPVQPRPEAPPIEEKPSCAEIGGDVWPEPLPLPNGLQPVESFDFALVPGTLRPWAQDICDRVQCPPDFVAVGIMAGLGALIGRKVGVRPQSKTDWTVTSNQWGLIVGRPGVLKSPALEQALAPLKRLAAQAVEANAGEIEEHRLAVQVAKLRAEAGEKEARKRLASNPGADVSELFTVAEPDAPTLHRYMANDTSAAALGELHRQNPNGLLVFRDEMVSLVRGLDREDQAEARGFYLTGWNGDSPYTFDRIGRGMNLHIPAVCLSLLGGTQPGRLSEYVRHAVRGGAADDGLIQRFGLLVWPETGGVWKDVDRWPDGDAKRHAFQVFDRLAKLDPADVDAQQDRDHNGEPDGLSFLRFGADALGLFLEWRTDLETRLRSGELHPALESHLAKYRKLIPGLALILHLANHGTGPVTEQATLQALAWGEYLESHARRAYGSVSQPETAAAKAVLNHIRKGDLQDGFAGWQVWRPGWALLSDREQVADALRLLVDYGHLREQRNDTGGRPATTYRVNPWVLS